MEANDTRSYRHIIQDGCCAKLSACGMPKALSFHGQGITLICDYHVFIDDLKVEFHCNLFDTSLLS